MSISFEITDYKIKTKYDKITIEVDNKDDVHSEEKYKFSITYKYSEYLGWDTATLHATLEADIERLLDEDKKDKEDKDKDKDADNAQEWLIGREIIVDTEP